MEVHHFLRKDAKNDALPKKSPQRRVSVANNVESIALTNVPIQNRIEPFFSTE
jgi:hypothetical protein